MEIKDFNVGEALNGAAIGFTSQGKVTQFIVQFKYSGENSLERRYSGIGQDDNNTYYFDQWGVCSDKDSAHKLSRIEELIDYTRGTVATRADGSGVEEISIDNMQPREVFAQCAMQSIIGKLDMPILSLDDYHIVKLCDLSFKIAQQMVTTAAEYREATQSGPDVPQDMDIDVNTVTQVSDKILFNMMNSLKTLQEKQIVIADNSTTIVNDGIKINGSVDTKVINTPDVRVTNLSEIPQPQITTYQCPGPCPDCPDKEPEG